MEPSSLYFITNKSVQPELLFRTEDDIELFLTKLIKHVSPAAEILDYSFTPTEFQLVIQTRSVDEVRNAREVLTANRKSLNRFIIQRFTNLFNSYAQSYNRQYEQEGALFRKNFQLHLINDIEHEEIRDFYMPCNFTSA